MRIRQLAAAVAVTVGLVVLVGIVVSHLPSAADAGEAATDLVRPELTAGGVAQHRADFELTKRATDQLVDQAMPAIGSLLGLSPAQMDSRYPNIATARAQRATIYPFAEKIVANLERHQSDFAAADDIPLPGLPMTAATWIALGAIVVMIALAVLVIWRADQPAPLIALALFGLCLVVGPYATGYPGKAKKADSVLDSLNVSHELAAQTRTHFNTMVAAANEFEQQTVPDLVKATGVSRQTIDAQLSAQFPALSEGRQQFAAVFARYDARVSIRERGVDAVNEAKKFPLRSVTLWTVVPGLAVLLTATGALVDERRRRSHPSTPVAP
jgi:hypothetical protein